MIIFLNFSFFQKWKTLLAVREKDLVEGVVWGQLGLITEVQWASGMTIEKYTSKATSEVGSDE